MSATGILTLIDADIATLQEVRALVAGGRAEEETEPEPRRPRKTVSSGEGEMGEAEEGCWD